MPQASTPQTRWCLPICILIDGENMSIYAFGDVHGCRHELTALLNAINPAKTDTLVFLGDLVDRGLDSKGVIDTIWAYQKHCQVIYLLGNHEQMLLDAYDDLIYKQDTRALDFWLRFGGDSTLWSFGLTDDADGLAKLPAPYISWLRQASDYHQNAHFIFTHATPYSNVAINDQDDIALRWRNIDRQDAPHISGKTIICGHTAQKSGSIYQHKGLIGIDTYAYGGGNLTALQIDDEPARLVVWQVSGDLMPSTHALHLM